MAITYRLVDGNAQLLESATNRLRGVENEHVAATLELRVLQADLASAPNSATRQDRVTKQQAQIQFIERVHALVVAEWQAAGGVAP